MNACVNCNTAIKPSSSTITCDGCNGMLHTSCSKLSDDEIRITRSAKRRVKLFCTKCDCNLDQFAKIINSINDLKVEFTANVSQQIASLREELNLRIDTIQQQLVDGAVTRAGVDFEEVVNEVNERQIRSKNLIIFGVGEQVGELKDRVGDDERVICEILHVISPDAGRAVVKVTRIGRVADEGRPRPIKVVLADQFVARKILRLKKNLINSNFPRIVIRDDKTPRQLEFLRSVQSSLKSRIDAGEKNLTIRYIGGIPQVTSILRQKN